MKYLNLILIAPLVLLGWVAEAQSSAKAKSKDRFREKDDPDNPTEIFNEVAANSKDMELAPAFYKNGVVFISNRKSKGGFDRKTGEAYFSLWFSPGDPNGKLTPAASLPLEVTTTKNEGPVTFSRDFKTLIYSQNDNKDGVPKAGKDGKVHMKIYVAADNGREWKRQGEMPFCSSDYDCMSPSLSPDNKRLYFSSNMPGGQGGYDIYYTDLSDAGWTKPANAGPVINSEADERFPFIAQSGTLFFSSNGHNTLGGYDLFFSNPTPEGFQEVYNLNAPYNTAANETSIIVDFDGKKGFFTSDREPGEGGLDIFSFKSAKGIQGIEKPKVIPAEIVVVDASTGEPLQGAAIHILQPSDDGFVSGNNNFYNLDLLPVQDQKNALSMQLVRKEADDLGRPDLLTNAAGKAQIDLTRYKSYFVLVNLDGYVTGDRLIVADKLESGKLKFGLRVQPPCMRAGGTVVSEKFGTRISNATVKFVHANTGFITLARTTLNGQFDACLPEEGNYVVTVEKSGFRTQDFRITARPHDPLFNEVALVPEADNPTAEDVMPLANGLREGAVIVMDKIFYEYNKATLNYSAVRHLDALYEFLVAYPEMEIDLISHTDTRGDARMNQELTEERSKNAKTYLVYRGISESRIRTFGKGETEPRNHCREGVECTDQEHQQNNRLEVRIVKLGSRP
ncbi:MAG TPA: OmpA family protein [Saprospiraceae bacterium]|nr:OmpA family protein [Saprospiraceae bacterium]HND87351.1 OmpA family protein [Saprospiraceae bacterium]